MNKMRYGNDPRDFLLKLCAEGLPSGFIAPLIPQVYPHKTRKYQKALFPASKIYPSVIRIATTVNI